MRIEEVPEINAVGQDDDRAMLERKKSFLKENINKENSNPLINQEITDLATEQHIRSHLINYLENKTKQIYDEYYEDRNNILLDIYEEMSKINKELINLQEINKNIFEVGLSKENVNSSKASLVAQIGKEKEFQEYFQKRNLLSEQYFELERFLQSNFLEEYKDLQKFKSSISY